MALDKNKFIGKHILEIKIAMINPTYLEYVEGKTWLSDVGIELEFTDGGICSVFYDENTDKFDLYERSLADHLEGVDHYFIEFGENDFLKELPNKEIINLETVEKTMEVQDYNGEVVESDKIPVEFLFEFSDDSSLQIATVSVQMSKQESAITEIFYNPEGNIWIGLDEKIDIS